MQLSGESLDLSTEFFAIKETVELSGLLRRRRTRVRGQSEKRLFVPHVRREVFQRFAGLHTGKYPFSNLPEKRLTLWALTADEMKECRSLKPRFVAQIEFTEWTPDGLRHPSFLGLRDDKDVQTVMREKLILQSS
jgi:hypothetical protein